MAMRGRVQIEDCAFLPWIEMDLECDVNCLEGEDHKQEMGINYYCPSDITCLLGRQMSSKRVAKAFMM